MSQWAEIRQMHVVDGVPKKQIAERLGLDIKTVRRAVAQATAPARRAVSLPRHLDRWRAQIEQWLRQDRRLTAKRIRRFLLPLAGPVAERTVRWYVARLKAAAAPKEVYVHRNASRCPRGDRVGREPEGDVASPHEGSVVLGPVPDAIRCRVLRMHSRLHIEIMTRRRSRWSTCRPLLAHRAESAHQRRRANSYASIRESKDRLCATKIA